LTRFRLSLFLLLAVLLAGCTHTQSVQPVTAPINLGDDKAEVCTTVEDLKVMQEKAYGVGYKAGLTDCSKRWAIGDIQLNNPTYAELLKFLRDDPSKRCKYENCMQRARDFADSARVAGWDTWVVLLGFSNGNGHVIMLFNTKDRGEIYVEPAYDIPVTVKMGMDYNQNFVDTPYPCSAESLYIQEIEVIK